MYKRFGKRYLDVFVGSIFLVCSLPLQVFIGLILLFDVGWPVMFRQPRVGLNGRAFLMFKFRTMRGPINTGEKYQPEFEQRASIFGRWLRRHGVDELPQFFNVVLGQMSLVGPRPDEPDIWDNLCLPPGALEILKLRPGLTGPVQVKFRKAETVDRTAAAHANIVYAKNLSFVGDCKLLLHTIRVVIAGR